MTGAAIVLFNCRYLGRAMGALRQRGVTIEGALVGGAALDADGYMLPKLRFRQKQLRTTVNPCPCNAQARACMRGQPCG
jgi:hypothetical protein